MKRAALLLLVLASCAEPADDDFKDQPNGVIKNVRLSPYACPGPGECGQSQTERYLQALDAWVALEYLDGVLCTRATYDAACDPCRSKLALDIVWHWYPGGSVFIAQAHNSYSTVFYFGPMGEL